MLLWKIYEQWSQQLMIAFISLWEFEMLIKFFLSSSIRKNTYGRSPKKKTPTINLCTCTYLLTVLFLIQTEICWLLYCFSWQNVNGLKYVCLLVPWHWIKSKVILTWGEGGDPWGVDQSCFTEYLWEFSSFC